MDYEQLATELIRAIRGRRSQVAFSRRLGYRTNVAYAWEHGLRWPTASVALRAAARCGIDVDAAFAQFYRTRPGWLDEFDPATPEFVARFLQDQHGQTSISDVAARAERNRYSVSRWIAGTVEPRLPDFLRLVEATSLRLVDLLAALVGPDGVPSARGALDRLEAQRNAAIEEPWSVGVLHFLQVRANVEGNLSDADIAACLQIPIDVTRRALARLERAGRARRDGDRWLAVPVPTVDTRRSEETARRLKAFWTGVGLDRLERGTSGRFAYNVMSISLDQLRRLEELQTAYYRAVRTLVAEDEPVECVALINLHLVRLDDGSASGAS